jgi:hypothetical protein
MKSLKAYLIIAGVLLVFYITAQLNQPRSVDWSENFSSKEKSPFGTYILFNRINDIFPGSKITTYRQPVYNVVAEDSMKNSSYLIVCQSIALTPADYEQLTNYIKQGNNVFIAADYFGGEFDKKLHLITNYNISFGQNDKSVRFLSPYLDSARQYKIEKGCGNVYFSKFDTARAVVIGENIDHRANFIKYSFGKGSLYLVSTPKLFSNYSLLRPQGAAYAATALSFLKGTKQLVVDEYYSQGMEEASPMRLFLSNPTLQWAYYITIFSLLIFVLFEIKRRQRIIPVIEPLSNATLDFVTVVGQVYYEKHDNANIAQKNITYLLAHLRDDYQLRADKLDNEFKEKLVMKTDIESKFVTELIDYINYISVQDKITDRELIKLNQLIEKFYIKAR